MKNIIKFCFATFLSVLLFASCTKDQIIDGGVSNPKVNMTTYDYLKSHPRGLFDTLIMIIDKGGMVDLINNQKTFFAPTDYSINAYISIRQSEIRRIDERKNYTLDSLFKQFTPQMLRDSMSVYLFPDEIIRTNLDATGKTYQSAFNNYSFLMTLEQHTNDDYNAGGLIPERPSFMYYNRVVGERDVLVAGQLKDPSGNTNLLDVKTICQTTGIHTNTGVLHVLNNGHAWIRSLKLNIK
ncbi:hypothetical protein [Sphingobacterium bovistauri]|uniref:Fasciclin domain-containing protein n=1 Tax=Sphingobacterium bovistauri TaxID=2781959 RepID=A0ABS7ZDE0_9SPHI|nr:hypothetical protein [Sphingobacterium bovistauri]MCA5006749.1 hypothetical protein [Sphingobacterium bovistauri]